MGSKLKAMAPMPSSPAWVNVPGFPQPDPDGRVSLPLVRLGQDVVGIGHGEVVALELVVLLLPHPRDLTDDLVPLRLGRVLVEDVERSDLVAACAPARAPLEPSLEEVVEHGHPLGRPHRVVHPRREVHDAGPDVDPVGGVGQIAHGHLGGRHVAVLGEGVVLPDPGVLPVVLVRLDHVLHLPQEHLVLTCGIMGRRPRQIPVDEDSELHGAGLLSLRAGARFHGNTAI